MLDHGRCLLSAKRREPFWKKEICKRRVCYSTDSLRRPSWVIDIHRKKIKNMRPPSVGRTVHSRDKEIKELRELKWQWHGFKRSFQGLRNRKWRNKASHIALSPTILYRSSCVCSFGVIYIQYKLQGWMNEKLSAVPAKDKREKKTELRNNGRHCWNKKMFTD